MSRKKKKSGSEAGSQSGSGSDSSSGSDSGSGSGSDSGSGAGSGSEPTSLRRKRAISVVPEVGDDGAEARKRLFTEPGEPGEPGEAVEPPAEGVVVKRRWLARSEPTAADASRDDDPVVDVEEERTAAARSAAAALRDALKDDGKPRRSASERARALEAEARAQGKRSPDVARAPKAPAPAPDQPATEPAGKRSRAGTLLPRRRRGTTEMLPPPAWQRHDALVVVVALSLLVGGAALHRRMARPELTPESERGLAFARPADWLVPARIGRPTTGLAVGGERGGGPSYHVAYQSTRSPMSRVEIRISERPQSGNLRSALALGRVAQHGEAHWADDSDERTIAGRDWVRTPYRYTFKAGERDEPAVARAIEYATLNGRLMYVVTVHGGEDSARELEDLVVPTLAVDPNHPAAIGNTR